MAQKTGHMRMSADSRGLSILDLRLKTFIMIYPKFRVRTAAYSSFGERATLGTIYHSRLSSSLGINHCLTVAPQNRFRLEGTRGKHFGCLVVCQ